MPVLERSELQASPLADLHAIANEVGLDGFRRLRKAELIDAILGESAPATESDDAEQDSERADDAPRARRRRPARARRSRADVDSDAADDTEPAGRGDAPDSPEEDDSTGGGTASASKARRGRRRGGRGGASADSESPKSAGADDAEEAGDATARIAAGVVEVLGNGSAFLRVSPPEPSDEDVYISAAQVRRCELVSGDRVTGPVRTPRRSERYPSLVRIDTINGDSADAVSDGARYDELAVDWARERLALGSKDSTLEAIEWLTPIGRGSRVVIVGARQAGKTETLRRIVEALQGRDDLEVTVVLAGARPEEIAEWREGPVAPVAALSFAASADSQDQAVERALEAGKRVAARGGHALVAIDGLDGLHPAAARKALAAARNLREAGSLTVIATATHPLGGETTVIALDATLTATGSQPLLDLVNSGTVKPELLVGEDGAEAITKARAAALEAE
ncbi:MAG TPA: Rho termination factor N-terminal domain-containing protein [Solirubrobacteraceae bacterium]|jgi:transcription termination factor Rho